jgi:hypothetical protein
MAKVIQIKISRQEIETAVKSYINRKIDEICKKQKVAGQISFEIEQATVEVKVPDYEERIGAIEFALDKLSKKSR